MQLRILCIVAGVFFLSVWAEQSQYQKDQYEFSKWKKKQKRHFYDVNEEVYRFYIFKRNRDKIEQQNRQKKKYKVGLNQFSDLTEEEFSKIYLNLKVPEKENDFMEIFQNQKQIRNEKFYNILKEYGIIQTQYGWFKDYSSAINNKIRTQLKNLDLRTLGQVNPIKNQGKCGSCWAFSTVASLESCYYKKYRKDIDLSEQQLIDCAFSYSGCEGGFMTDAMEWIIDNNGITSERYYPYSDSYNSYCKTRSSIAFLQGWKKITDTKESIKQALNDYGVLAIAVDASEWYDYESGIFVAQNQKDLKPNHAVNLVGYGSDEGEEYWLVRNCWGEEWGENGYIRLNIEDDHTYFTQYTYAVIDCF